MYITSTFLSYIFLGMFLIALVFFLYYNSLLSKTSQDDDTKAKIVGDMKKPERWRQRNSNISKLSLFWAIVSFIAFVYLKFFNAPKLINSIYLLIYLAAEILSIIIFGMNANVKKKVK